MNMEIGGDIVSVFFAVLMGAMALGQAAPNLPAIASGQGAAVPIFDILDTPSEIDAFAESGSKPQVKGNLTFDNISFSYPSRKSEKVFEGFSLEIK
jgi:ATP-binding cassette subfamily B (MDR/TAP) protein 1